ncbi:regulatory helix-turn-helix LysR family protein [Paenibacillus taihuensis]|uniref:Regulatory helix-turn-helix LysR family protein n=1 Tax=Paenibacillus taihuensis TaxID=1156355 RepID=A0A3D9SFE5_9BACL|nr:regulatory helix-turn-helix LysR family protein [Paenibacillus taihuensis]
MKTESLEAFLQTVELRSLTKASEVLHISQPALSKQIRNLEDELGTQLFIRSTTGVTLTATGTILFERSKRIMEEFNTLRREIALQEGTRLQLTIGSWPSVATVYLPTRIAGHKQKDVLLEYGGNRICLQREEAADRIRNRARAEHPRFHSVQSRHLDTAEDLY